MKNEYLYLNLFSQKQAQKPTSVTHSLVGNFTHDNELNLIVA